MSQFGGRDSETREILKLLWELRAEVKALRAEIRKDFLPHLASIEIAFSPFSQNARKIQLETGALTMPDSVAGPVILTTAGEQATASILGFDQAGNPWTGPIPPVTFSSSDTSGAIITSVPNLDGVTDLVTAVGNGVASLTASLTTAEGLSLSDTETVTVTLPVTPPPTPVLSSIKVAFA